MSRTAGPQQRLARRADAPRVARLHAESWRRHYRGAYADAFLDGDVEADRRNEWSRRLQEPDRRRAATILAEQGGSLLGFVHAIFDDDQTWEALVDNLHVAVASQRSGLGTRLMAAAAGGRDRALREERPVRVGARAERAPAGLLRGARRTMRRARARRGPGRRRGAAGAARP